MSYKRSRFHLEWLKLTGVRKFSLAEVQKLTLIDTAMNTGKLVVYSKVVFGKLSERSKTEHGLFTIYLLDNIVVGILSQPRWLRPRAIV